MPVLSGRNGILLRLGCSRAQQLWPVSGIWPKACFYKYILLEHSHAHSFTYVSMAAFLL